MPNAKWRANEGEGTFVTRVSASAAAGKYEEQRVILLPTGATSDLSIVHSLYSRRTGDNL